MDYPREKSWWRPLSPEAFCTRAGLGVITTTYVDSQISLFGGGMDDDNIRNCATVNLKLLFGKLSVPPFIDKMLHSDLDELVKIWVLLRREFDETRPSILQQYAAVQRAQSLVAELPAPAPAPVTPRDLAKAADAFGRSEKPTEKGEYASEAVYTTLHLQYSTFYTSSNDYLAPYTTVVGPSGIGKSFAMKQLAVRHGLYVAYSNLAPESSLVYPRPVVMGPTPVRVYSPDEESMVATWKIFLKNQISLAECSRAVGITPAGLFEFLTSSDNNIASARDRLASLLLRHRDSGVLASMDRPALLELLSPIKGRLDSLGLNAGPISPHDGDDHCPVIVCIDEARTRLDGGHGVAFQRLRTAAQNMVDQDENSLLPPSQRKQKLTFFIVLLDTTSKISDFTPPIQYDHSAKFQRKSLYHPIYRIDTFGLFSDPAAALADPSGTTEAVTQLFSHGRPLWAARLNSGITWQNLVGIVRDKIADQKDALAYGLSLLTYRMNFYVCSPTLAETMVASSMRFLIAISGDRNSFITTQPSEPVLAFAAACLLQDPPVRLASIQAWISTLHSGAVNPGDIGEQVASLVLLFASDQASQHQPIHGRNPVPTAPKAISLQAAMTALLGEDAWQTMRGYRHGPATSDILDRGLVFFNHFIRVASVPTLGVLETAYRRGAALFLPTNFAGMDVAIPIRMPSTGRMAVLLIQIKNRRDDSFTPGLKMYMGEALKKAEEALGSLSGELHGIVGLVMCLRTCEEPHFAATNQASDGSARVNPRRGKRSRKGKEVVNVAAAAGEQRPEPAPAELLGIAFGLHEAVYPCMKAPAGSAGSHTAGLHESEEICTLLRNLLESWPDAFSREDVGSSYAQRLLDPFFEQC